MPLSRHLLKVSLLFLAGVALCATPPGYADPSACRSCHSHLFDDYAQTAMGRSFYLPSEAKLIEDWQENNRFYHAASERYYEMTQREGKLFVRRYQLDPEGKRVHLLEKVVTHIMGSGERARSYLHRSPDGRIIELPVSWYSQEDRWAMAPGYDRSKHSGFSRAVNYKCMFCHNGYPDVPPETARQGWDHDPKFPEELPLGIDCQRCHGPGAEHVAAARKAESLSAIQDSIVNPTHLSNERQLDICMQCHLETTSFRLPETYRRLGRSFFSYRPGEPLGDYIVHFDHAPGSGHDDKFEIVSAAYRLRQSACFTQSGGELLCTSCHDPHRSVAPTEVQAHYRAKCFTCHTAEVAEKHPGDEGRFTESNCIDCHMPPRRTEDVIHVVMTDHRIQRHKPDRDLLAPLAEKTDEEQTYRGEVVLYYPENSLEEPLRDVYLGIAQVKEAANLKPGVEWLERALKKAKVGAPEPYYELAEAQVKLGQRDAARRSYLRAIELDSNFVQVHNNLGNLLADRGKPREAIEQYRQALELDPSDGAAHDNLGLAFLDLGDQSSAEQAFRRAIAAHPMYAQAHLNLGSLLLVQGKLAEAQASLEQAVTLDPADAKARNNLGLALLGLARSGEAIPHLEYALREGDEGVRQAAKRALKLIRRRAR